MTKTDNIRDLFSVPIYVYTPSTYAVLPIQREIRDKLEIVYKNDRFANPPGWDDGVKTNFSVRTNSVKDYDLTKLQKYITEHTHNYLKSMHSNSDFNPEKFPISMVESWINSTSKNEGQNWHSHGNSVISGCYYYKTTENDGNIEFENPNPFVVRELFPHGYRSPSNVSIKPKVGKIILFPGWLTHRVLVNQTDSERISISFNFLYDVNKEDTKSSEIKYE